MAQNRSYDPPISAPPPPGQTPRTISQVDTYRETSAWGAIPKVVPRPLGGIPLQPSIVGKSDGATR